jgi:hypothetical protein
MSLKSVVNDKTVKVDLGAYSLVCNLETIEYFCTIYKDDKVIHRNRGELLTEVLSRGLNHMIKLYFDDNK